jgi:hemolysin activation/secretion protein
MNRKRGLGHVIPFSLSARTRAIALALAALGAPAPLWAQTGPSAAPPEVSFTVTRFEVTGDNPLDPARTQEVLKPFLGVQQGIAGLEAARAAVDATLRGAGYSLYHVTLPPQETVSVIRINVARVKVANIEVRGQKYFEESNIRASVPSLVAGQSPDIRAVARELEMANDNPAKHTTLGMKGSDTEDSIDAVLQTSDRNPLTFTAGYNTSGNDDQGGRSRIVGYLQDANLFGLDQVGSVAYTTSPSSPNEVKQYGLYYKAPIYAWGGAVSASYSYSSVSTGALGSGQVVTGAGRTTGVSYTVYLYPVGTYRSSVALGVDDKLFTSPTINGITVPGGDVRSRPISVTYVASYSPGWGTLSLNAEFDKNLPSGEDNTDVAYRDNRFGATRDWDATRLVGSVVVPIGHGWAVSGIVRGQYSADPLIAGEQFGLGGAASIRGAEERAVTGDSGVAATLEIYTPELYTGLRLLGFSDNGYIERHDAQPGETSHETLQSVGFGLRFSWQNAAQLSVDYGYITHGSRFPSVPAGTSRVHANLTYTF